MVDPYPIESTLAQGMMDPRSSGVATALMPMYLAQRASQTSNYMDQIGQQRQLAQQQLQATMADNIARALTEGYKSGSTGLLAANPLLGGTLFAGMDPATRDYYINQANLAHQGEMLKTTGEGVNQLSMAGLEVSPQTASTLTGGVPMTQGTPRDIAVANIKAAATLGAAAMPRVAYEVNDPEGLGKYSISARSVPALQGVTGNLNIGLPPAVGGTNRPAPPPGSMPAATPGPARAAAPPTAVQGGIPGQRNATTNERALLQNKVAQWKGNPSPQAQAAYAALAPTMATPRVVQRGNQSYFVDKNGKGWPIQ